MDDRNKTAIFEILCKQDRPLALKELMALLKTPVPERTIRRRIQELIADGYVKKIGASRSARYLAEKKIASSLTPEDYIKQPLHRRTPKSYSYAWLEQYIPNKTFYLSAEQRALFLKYGQRAQKKEALGTYVHHIYNRLLIDLSYNSSRLEGNTYSFLETQRLLLSGEESPEHPEADKIMILNHKEAIRFLANTASRKPFSINMVYTLHYLLSDALLPPSACGAVRTHGVRIGGSTYIPYEDSERLTKLLIEICNKSAEITDPFERSFFLLVHLSYLQAFEDVNKRTARLVSNIPLIQNDLVPLSFNELPKENYQDAIVCIYELNDTTLLAKLYEETYLHSCSLYRVTIESMGIDKTRVIYRSQRRAFIQQAILNLLHHEKLNLALELYANEHIPGDDQQAFISTVQEDLTVLSENTIAGMGISQQDFNNWKSSA